MSFDCADRLYENDAGILAIKEPLDTVTARDRFGLVTIDGVDYQIVDNTGALSADLRKSKILQ